MKTCYNSKTLRLYVCLAALALAAVMVAQDVVTPSAKNIQISGGVNGTNWLTIYKANLSDPTAAGLDFDPSFTYLLCDYKPIVHRLSNGKYEITFTSEIADGLP